MKFIKPKLQPEKSIGKIFIFQIHYTMEEKHIQNELGERFLLKFQLGREANSATREKKPWAPYALKGGGKSVGNAFLNKSLCLSSHTYSSILLKTFTRPFYSGTSASFPFKFTKHTWKGYSLILYLNMWEWEWGNT